uniref:aspartate carbamoyltransferase n=1 Tax=Mucochytrium quahogii TaxID=96639 RepID=A0A7S2RQY9_9STRA|mmetsp:Transcript_12825/g.20763  ORF Transcript_12825/g.20763 Transcript_12825/m.20763 type:complete len:324 (+) Transcript_12825:239-1210(+)|eukprot:CAMPEP_0203746908 /NCGR_PEP_ID=MMETSP0098-20131031/2203_1 /ASSEMBLY_ACC=CAM_ASM_000208 /TAXON_ID=96639 /ORGANISM=" , Strain NY0313808BC1" /LENGTH=323 /DNA_ID=CAMNT_0050635161 /DNA_START=127 /DNA_END=1098 /DNA_ORIENTATION=-
MSDTDDVALGPLWAGEQVLSVAAFTKESVNELFAAADKCKAAVNDEPGCDKSVLECCKHKVLALVFYEPSTRTNCSFAAAMLRLGGTYLQVNESSSSVKKGETLEDTLRCLACYSDLLVLRHPEKGSVARVSAFLRKPLINAGDGDGEHPTQALLDLYTILKEQGRIEGLTITMLGDLKYGRTTHSLAKLLAMFHVTLNYVTPPGLEMPEYVKDLVKAGGLVEQNEFSSLDDVIQTTDVLYVTRVQKERFASVAEYEKVQGSFVVDAKVLSEAKTTCCIMHPLPRVGEIAPEVDTFPSAAYFRQMENGMYVRMALIAKVLNKL